MVDRCDILEKTRREPKKQRAVEHKRSLFKTILSLLNKVRCGHVRKKRMRFMSVMNLTRMSTVFFDLNFSSNKSFFIF